MGELYLERRRHVNGCIERDARREVAGMKGETPTFGPRVFK